MSELDVYDIAAASVVNLSHPGHTFGRGADYLRETYIMIRRADLPAQESILHVGTAVKSGGAVMQQRGGSPEYAESMARHYLALAQWLREHPPVDEAQVKAMAALVVSVEDDLKGHYGEPADGFARALVRGGARVEGVGEK